ncbi:MAG: LysM peptidoglycan-binding domain-containing protein [Pseudomonadota bacterium]|nr:LysM peptidoglycan-binding domain-containing protein [Pseudomonadota bacterium]
MTFRFRRSVNAQPAAALNCAVLALAVLAAAPSVTQAFPITPAERSTAQQVASKGVPLSELAENAPDTYTVKRGDTLWHISGMFLKSPWRWPELWGMNLEQIHNPHLIYPGQLLVLEKIDGMARLKLGSTVGGVGDTIKLSPSIRSDSSESAAVASIPMNLISPFLTDAMIFDANQMATAPRIVAAQEGHLMMGRGNTAYVSGDLGNTRNWQIFREPKALVDPDTKEVLGYEARYVGSAERKQDGESRPGAQTGGLNVPSTFTITGNREDAAVGDRLAPATVRDFAPFVPHPPANPVNGKVVSLYGDAMSAGTNQIVSLNRGARDGLERGTVLALWHEGAVTHDKSVERGALIKLPDERIGMVFVFRVFDRMSYGLLLDTTEPTVPGDRVSQP